MNTENVNTIVVNLFLLTGRSLTRCSEDYHTYTTTTDNLTTMMTRSKTRAAGKDLSTNTAIATVVERPPRAVKIVHTRIHTSTIHGVFDCSDDIVTIIPATAIPKGYLPPGNPVEQDAPDITDSAYEFTSKYGWTRNVITQATTAAAEAAALCRLPSLEGGEVTVVAVIYISSCN
jgi:hypothetical protein